MKHSMKLLGPVSQGGLRALPLRRRVDASAAALDRPAPSGPTGQASVLVAFEVPACQLAFGEHLRVGGSCAELGSWDAAKAPALGWAGEARCCAGGMARCGSCALRVPPALVLTLPCSTWDGQLLLPPCSNLSLARPPPVSLS